MADIQRMKFSGGPSDFLQMNYNKSQAKRATDQERSVLATRSLAHWRTAQRQEFIRKHAVAPERQVRVKFRYSGKTNFTDAEKRYFEAVIEDMSKFVDYEAIGKRDVVVKVIQDKSGRASAYKNTIYISRVEHAKTITHEFGHVLESLSDMNRGTVHKDIQGYLHERLATRGKGVRPMLDIVPGSSYAKSEVADEDEFAHPYMGKMYYDYFKGGGAIRATEIGSMASEDIFALFGYRRGADEEMLMKVLSAWRGVRFP